MGIAALLVFAFTILNFQNLSQESKNTPLTSNQKRIGDSSISEKTVFAVLTNSVGLRWNQDASTKPNPGESLDFSVLEIESGLAQLEFIKGSTVILEGPVEFEIKGTNAGSLKNGKLRANVPPVAKRVRN